MEYTLIIPDVHGRRFWRTAVDRCPNSEVIFLGDYLDPYSWEGISHDEAFREMMDIIDFKKANRERVTLLLGNHDLGYLDERINTCRRDEYGAARNRKMLESNLDLFDIVHTVGIKTGEVLFSHAGIADTWIKNNRWLCEDGQFRPEILNELLHNPDAIEVLFKSLSQVSAYRGGLDDVGSPVWADVDEFMVSGDFLPGYMHVFGHSLQDWGPIYVNGKETDGWCLDCRKPFLMDDNGNLYHFPDADEP